LTEPEVDEGGAGYSDGPREEYIAHLIEDLCVQYRMTGNPLYAWKGYRVWNSVRHRGAVLPAWIADYLDRVAANLEELTWNAETTDAARAITKALEMSPKGPSVFRKGRSGDRRTFRYVAAVEKFLAQGDKLDQARANAAKHCRVSESTIKRAWRARVRVSRKTMTPKT
jgi:hypothetical protein